MARPLLLEINTRCWLRTLAGEAAKPAVLGDVPGSLVLAWKEQGYSHIWLMGVWTTGPRTLAIARSQKGQAKLAIEAFGPHGVDHLVSSPYAIADYKVADALGGAEGMKKFRALLNKHGLALVLDFVPNHLGLDHRWVEERTDLFVNSAEKKAGTFKAGERYVAHGKDPFFAPWVDTAQLDYRNPTTRRAMTDALLSVADQCDGVRCDMAMLLLNEIFDKTWANFPREQPVAQGEFWLSAIAEVKQRHPNFIFAAEAYWDKEPALRKVGFDFCYDKKFLDFIVERKFDELLAHIRAVKGKFNPVRFLTNHDEAPVASTFPALERAAAVFLLAQPGMCMIYDGQLMGRTHKAPVQFDVYWPEPRHPDTEEFYRTVIRMFAAATAKFGEPEFRDTGVKSCFAIERRNGEGARHLVFVNLGDADEAFDFNAGKIANIVKTNLSDGCSARKEQGAGWHIELVAHGYMVLEWQST